LSSDGQLCPSADAAWPEAEVFGVVLGEPDAPRVGYLARPAPLTPELVDSTAPAGPGPVLRVAAPCAESRCQHFQHERCRLAQNLVTFLPTVTKDLPPCAVRARCRWWRQEGREACFRCPQVQTDQTNASPEILAAVTTDLDA
jgi:hypothetical protein